MDEYFLSDFNPKYIFKRGDNLGYLFFYFTQSLERRIKMSNDISTQYTKTRNKEQGRRGYCLWKHEKETNISPKDYGMFLQKLRKGKRK